MTTRGAAWIGWSLAGACALMSIPALVLAALGVGMFTPGDTFVQGGLSAVPFVLAALAFSGIGALIVSRIPRNAVGWIFCLIGLLIAVGNLAYQYADRGLYGAPGSLPGAHTAAWLQNLGLTPAFGLLALSLLLFPDGRLPSARWRPAAGVALVGVLGILGYAIRPGPLDWPFVTVTNPHAIAGSFDLTNRAVNWGWGFMALAAALAGWAMWVRLRRSRGVQRQQLKWIALAAVLGGFVLVVNAASFYFPTESINKERSVVLGLVFAAAPMAAGIGILRHRLYDIDVVINRALVYGSLTAMLAGAYLGSVLLLELVLSGVTAGNGLAVAASTLAVAALFQPARRRIQATVDRRFFRRKYDAARTLQAFGVRLRDEVDLDALGVELRGVVAETMQPAHLSLWLREPGR